MLSLQENDGYFRLKEAKPNRRVNMLTRDLVHAQRLSPVRRDVCPAGLKDKIARKVVAIIPIR